MTPIAEVRLSVTLDRERTMIFNVNTMRAFEKASAQLAAEEGREPHSYWDCILGMLKYYEDHGSEITQIMAMVKDDPMGAMARQLRLGSRISHYISASDLQAMTWATIHEYPNGKKKPVWPLDLDDIGLMVHPQETINLINKILEGHSKNSPSKAEVGEVSGAGGKVVTMPSSAEPAPTPSESGGDQSIALPADAFA